MLVFRGREEGTDELTLTASFQHGTSPEEVLISELNTLKRYFTTNHISFFLYCCPIETGISILTVLVWSYSNFVYIFSGIGRPNISDGPGICDENSI